MTTSTHVGSSCKAPDCEKIVFFSSSKYCHLHQHRETQVSALSNGPSTTSPTRTSRLSGRGFTAKRGRRYLFATPSPRPLLEQYSRSRESSSTVYSARATQTPITKASDPAPKSNENATSSQVKPLTAESIQKQLGVDFQTETAKDINQPRNQAPVANMGPELRDLETDAQKNEQSVYSTTALDLDLTTGKTFGGVPAPRGFKKAEPSPVPSSQPKLSPTAPVKFMQSNSENSPDLKPRLQASSNPYDSPKRPEHHSPQKLKNPTNRPLTPAKRSSHQASKTLPFRKHSSQVRPLEVSTEVDDEVNMADVSDNDEEVPKPAKAVLPFRAKVESRRKRILAEFDSEAFDSLIYRQSSMRPPAKVIISSRTVRYEPVLPEREPLYLPVNPAIHQMHKRSSAWKRIKTNEISQRPRKKASFGKVMERARRERDTEAKRVEKCRQAQQNGTIPPYKPPKPRSVRRLLDFGDVAEEDLPDYVRSNPAWLKACAWHRECERKAALHQQRVDKSTEEAERFYNDTFGDR